MTLRQTFPGMGKWQLPPEVARLADRRPGILVRAWHRISRRRIEVALLAIVAIAGLIALFKHWPLSLPSPFEAPPVFETIFPGEVRVIDGDTIRYKDVAVRLVGFNAPETGQRALCEAERKLGERATQRLTQLLRGGFKVEFAFVACACSRGTEGTPACNFGRRCGILKVGGRDVGAILIEEGLAVPFRCGATSCPRLPQPWCQSANPL
jgi:endonuclease YncB( thermonuclease family)